MTSKHPNTASVHHVCTDTFGSIATAFPKGEVQSETTASLEHLSPRLTGWQEEWSSSQGRAQTVSYSTHQAPPLAVGGGVTCWAMAALV